MAQINTKLTSFLFCLFSYGQIHAQQIIQPDTILVEAGSIKLKGLLWQPHGNGPFPAIIFCHGSYETGDARFDLVQQISSWGKFFASKGYIFLGLCRRGVGLSKGSGENSADVMARALKERGLEERNRVQMQ